MSMKVQVVFAFVNRIPYGNLSYGMHCVKSLLRTPHFQLYCRTVMWAKLTFNGTDIWICYSGMLFQQRTGGNNSGDQWDQVRDGDKNRQAQDHPNKTKT